MLFDHSLIQIMVSIYQSLNEFCWKYGLQYELSMVVDCPKIIEDKSSESRVQTPDAGLIIATTSAPRREGRNPRLSIIAVASLQYQNARVETHSILLQ